VTGLDPLHTQSTTQAIVTERLDCHAVYGTLMPHGVLVGLDGTRTSMRAVDYAIGHAMRTRSSIIGAHVRPLTSSSGLAMGMVPHPDFMYDDIAESLYGYLASRSWELNIVAGLVDLYGSPIRQLRRMAVVLSPDVLVVGGSTRVGRLQARAVGPALARGARQPVIVVP
jgi:nucleotide-binding universal stress UspA family protein